MKTYVATLAYLIFTCSSACADSWSLEPEVKDTEFVFGDTRVVLHYDSTKNDRYPEYRLNVYLEGKPVGEYEDVGFTQVFPSADNAFFRGVSNDGLIKDAYVIFDRGGRILKKQPHDLKKVNYFEISPTLRRKWYDKDNPNPRFSVVDGKLKDVRINACDGASVSLLIREDLSLRAFLLEYVLKRRARPKEICYVSFGHEFNRKTREMVRYDPPKRFLERFRNRPYQIKPASAYPKPQDAEVFPINNPQTGIPDGMCTVEIVEWIDENTARVKAGMYRHGEWGAGEEAIAQKQGGKWAIKKSLTSWRS